MDDRAAHIDATSGDKPGNLLGFVPDDWGRKFEFGPFGVTLTRIGPNSVSFSAGFHYAVQMLSAQPDRETALSSDRMRRFAADRGTLELIPHASEFSGRWYTPKENCLFAFDHDWLESFAARELDCGHLELQPPPPGTVDQAGYQIAGLIRDEIDHEIRPSHMYLEGLALSYAARILRNHSSARDRKLAPGHAKGGLSPRNWKDVEDFIQANLTENFSLTALAELCNLSYSHFTRAFRKTAGMSPYRYVLNQRLIYAQNIILRSDLALAEVATLAGFSSQSHLTSTMRRLHCVTPAALRKSKY
ncbi:AraC family transcriptional regulator [Martelella soudanensis]|uniref:AraC family transcriptional regulator n=1 Tax=unclassified Martelella TaxID=2629616 RepID=UPI0015DD7F6B|nr:MULTISPECIES: AraC family transcriptional regulator [unclassified Martelella]